MKKLLTFIIPLLPLLLMGCLGKNPLKNEIAGKWISKDGAILELKKDATFIGTFLPADHFNFNVFTKKTESKQKVEGKGRWTLEKAQGQWQVSLEFNEMNKGYHGLSVLVSGSNLFENNPPWYLFYWLGEEEGGDRYKFGKH